MPAPGPDQFQPSFGLGYFDNDFAYEDPDLRPPPGERFVFAKVAFTLRANRTATLVVPPAHRANLGLGYLLPTPHRRAFTVTNGGAAMTFEACDPSTPAQHHEWKIGAWTRFNGGFFYRRPGCYPVELFVRGQRSPYRLTMSFAAGPCERRARAKDAGTS